MRSVEFSLLGPLNVHVGGKTLRLGGSRQRTVITMLLLSPGQVISVDTLIDAVWPNGGPSTARNQIAICVAGLRKVFKDATDINDVILTTYPGYTLNPDGHRIDVRDFEEGVRAARESAREGHVDDACRQFGDALRLWQGRALDGLTGTRIEAAASRLEELRLDVAEELAGLRLKSGNHNAVVGELTEIVKEYPLRERARAHLMLAHYRAGRRAEALAVFAEARRVLVAELGIEPGPALQELHAQVLRDAPTLTGVLPEPTHVAPAPTPAQLPSRAAAFTGRVPELRALDRMLDERSGSVPLGVAAISGVSGVGKTALAVHWANRVAHRFPDGQLFADLRGYDEHDEPVPPAVALDRFLRALGVPGSQIPADPADRPAFFRSMLGGRQVLIVLDNVRSFDQIRPLLPGSGRCCVLITGRDVTDDMIGDYDVLPIRLKAVTAGEATALLSEVAGRERIDADPPATTRLAELCDRLPLALRIAGARLAARPHWSVRYLVTRLENQRIRLDELSPGTGGVRAGFGLAYRELPSAARRMYRRLGLLTVPDFTAWVGAAVLDTTTEDAENLMELLVDAHLLEVVSGAGTGPVTRYRFQDLLRLYAYERAVEEEPEGQRDAAFERVLDGWLYLCDAAYRQLSGGEFTLPRTPVRPRLSETAEAELLGNPLEWMDSEWIALADVIKQAAQCGQATHAWVLTALSSPLREARNYLEGWAACAELSLEAARAADDRLGEAEMVHSLGALAIYRNDYAGAQPLLTVAVGLFTDCGDVGGRAKTQRLLAGCAQFSDDLELARSYCEASLEGFRSIGDLAGEATTLSRLAQIELDHGNVDRSLELSGAAVDLSRKAGIVRGEAQSIYRLANALLRKNDLDGAARALREVLTLSRSYQDLHGEAHALRGLGEIHWRQGRLDESLDLLGQALETARKMGDRLLRARIEGHLGFAHALIGHGEAADRMMDARAAFTELGATALAERMRLALDLVMRRGLLRPVDRQDLLALLV
ncbi:AfsR/SARP family transcriptional regulator [Kitasatospora xanthocidica]|uniref:AfsR/SARP family transcriptional regulator n=1 Tax=Kitasatospora xanthocidica TaxID=83382 RepID=UPI00227D7189|nr:BTAD domain-containing putative transcriptional regulator [Kitasatospora xanthocidica]